MIASGSGAMTSHVLGVKDQVIVALLSNKLGGGIFSKSEIKKPEDLKGKLIATGRPGALNDILVRYVLTRKWGLSPDRDVKLMPIGEPPLMLQALERGVVDATSLSVPASFLAKSKGFFELVNYDALGLTYPQHALTTLRPTIAKNPQLVERVLILHSPSRFLKATKKRVSPSGGNTCAARARSFSRKPTSTRAWDWKRCQHLQCR